MRSFTMLDWVVYVLVIVGGLNWGFMGLANLNIVSAIFGTGFLARLIYILIGASAAYLIYSLFIKKS